ncbi:MAG: hypothetical protein ABI550_07315 [Ignavibacteriaceae bacterium]
MKAYLSSLRIFSLVVPKEWIPIGDCPTAKASAQNTRRIFNSNLNCAIPNLDEANYGRLR